MTNQRRLIQSNGKRHNIKKIDELPGFNASFMTKANMRWFLFVVNWLPNKDKPLVFLPCGSANKTRAKYGKKMISQGLGHQFMSAITRNDDFERVILSEPLTIIPYALEDHPLRPDYNIPPEDLSIQSERIFINQLSLWLLRVKSFQHSRRFVYYVGATHHYFILTFANKIAGTPFSIIHSVPKNGLAGYSKAAERLKDWIYDAERTRNVPELEEVSLRKHIRSRGRYTNRKFWKEVIILHYSDKRLMEFSSSRMKITSREDFEEGFSELYSINKLLESEENAYE